MQSDTNTFARIWEGLDSYRLADLLPELNPKPRSGHVLLTCPGCGRPEAWLYPSRDGRGPHIHCNRRNNCGYDVPLWQYVKARENDDGAVALQCLTQAAQVEPKRGLVSTRLQLRRRLAWSVEAGKIRTADPPVASAGTPPTDLHAHSRTAFQSLPDNHPAITYLHKRGLTRAQADAAGIGFAAQWPDDQHPRLTYPLFDAHGTIIAVEGRIVGAPSEKARKSMCHGPKSGVFIPGGRFDPVDAHICEGPFDAIALKLAGRNAMALCGGAAPSWLACALAYRTVYLATDADPAGDKAAARIAAETRPYGAIARRVRPPVPGSDWGDLLQVGGLEAVVDGCGSQPDSRLPHLGIRP